MNDPDWHVVAFAKQAALVCVTCETLREVERARSPELRCPRVNAVILGASGEAGSRLLRELLASPRWSAVTAIVRRPLEVAFTAAERSKLDVRLISMDALETVETSAEAAFCTLGVGQPRKVSAEEHRRVDVEYATAFGRACRSGGTRHFTILTSIGADVAARNRYVRVKGEVEERIRMLGFPRTTFVQPSLLVTDEIRYGLQDRVLQTFFPMAAHLLPSRYHQIHVDALARAMRLNAERTATSGVETLQYREFQELLEQDDRV